MLFTQTVFGIESNNTDSLKATLEGTKDTSEVNRLWKLTFGYWETDRDSFRHYAHKMRLLANEINYPKGEAQAYFFLGNAASYGNNYDLGLHYHQKAWEIWKESGTPDEKAKIVNSIGTDLHKKGELDKALIQYFESLKLAEKHELHEFAQIPLNNIGRIYQEMGNDEKAVEYYSRALDITQKSGSKKDMADCLNNLGSFYLNKQDHGQALEYYEQVLSLYKEIDHKQGVAHGYNNIGIVHFYMGDPEKCLDYFLKALMIRKAIGEKKNIAQSLNNIGLFYQYQGDFENAIDYYFKSLQTAQEVGAPVEISDAYSSLAEAYGNKEDFEKAYSYYRLYTNVKDSIYTEDIKKQIAEMEARYESEKKQREIQMKDLKLGQQDLKIQKQKTQNYALIGGIFLVLIIAVILFNRYQLKQKANQKLAVMNEQLEEKNEQIEEKSKEITDSIRYAKRIQDAILPPETEVAKILPDSFILYKPKNIVSGDFYWVESPLTSPQSEAIYFAAVDCTGHGVPGGFMSIVGHNGLNQAVNEQGLTQPAAILDFLNKTVNKTLRQSLEESKVKDGMDIALCCLEKGDEKSGKHMLQYAGAFNPLYIVRKSGGLEEIKADKQPIGSFIDEEAKPFINHYIELEKGDKIYLFSDGYADQFGGKKGKKLKYKRFKQMLLAIAGKSLKEQKKILDTSFEEWRGSLEQIDDVCIIGVSV